MKGIVCTANKAKFTETSLKPFQFIMDKKTKSDVIQYLDVSRTALVGKSLVAFTAFSQRNWYHYYGSKCNGYPAANCDLIVSNSTIAISTIRTINPNEELLFANDGVYNAVEPITTIGTSLLYSGFCNDQCISVLQSTIPVERTAQVIQYLTTVWVKYHENQNTVSVIIV